MADEDKGWPMSRGRLASSERSWERHGRRGAAPSPVPAGRRRRRVPVSETAQPKPPGLQGPKRAGAGLQMASFKKRGPDHTTTLGRHAAVAERASMLGLRPELARQRFLYPAGTLSTREGSEYDPLAAPGRHNAGPLTRTTNPAGNDGEGRTGKHWLGPRRRSRTACRGRRLSSSTQPQRTSHRRCCGDARAASAVRENRSLAPLRQARPCPTPWMTTTGVTSTLDSPPDLQGLMATIERRASLVASMGGRRRDMASDRLIRVCLRTGGQRVDLLQGIVRLGDGEDRFPWGHLGHGGVARLYVRLRGDFQNPGPAVPAADPDLVYAHAHIPNSSGFTAGVCRAISPAPCVGNE